MVRNRKHVMKLEVILFFTLLLYIICCSIIGGIGIFTLNQYLVCILVGCIIFLMYYVVRYIGNLLGKSALSLYNLFLYGESYKVTNFRLNTCVNLFLTCPLLTRRIIELYNKSSPKNVAKEIIDNYKRPISKQYIEDNIPYNLVKKLSEIDLEDKRYGELENRLREFLNLNNKYPKAVSYTLRYSSFPLHKFELNKTYSSYELLTINNDDLMSINLDEKRLQDIEKHIDNISYLDSHLYDLFPVKPEAKSIVGLLANHGQEYLYHFTHKDNIKQIKEMGGLYSWVQLDQMGKPCQHPGGDSLSRKLDTKYGVADYVHLSFSYDHPMAYRNEKDVVILYIHPIVCLFPNTLFTNMNATDKNHSIGGSYDDLKNINMWATKMTYVSSESLFFKAKQAEVLVKGHIPSQFIVNLYFV